MMKYSEVTIIIPHFGSEERQCKALKECLLSLSETSPDIKVLIAKNGPRCLCPRAVRVVEQGQCKAVNAAVATVSTPWVIISNDDMIYPPQWFERLIDFIPKIADEDINHYKMLCVSPKLIEPQDGAPTFEKYFCGGADGDFDKAKFLEFDRMHRGEGLRTGFNLPFLIEKNLWDLIGGYDVNYDPWGSNSDSDLEYKIRLAGIQPYQNTNAIVYHFSQTSGTFEPKNGSYWGNNFAYFKEKWGFDRTDKGIWEANFMMPTIEQGRKFQPFWEGFYSK